MTATGAQASATSPLPSTLSEAAVAVLSSAAPEAKVALTRQAAARWADGEIAELGQSPPPNRPARPHRPELVPPRRVRRRRLGRDPGGRIALLHALAHIELNAVDLAWDLIARFVDAALPRAFYDDWCRVAYDEARHFDLLNRRLQALGARYGDLPAHDGLWQAATATAHDVLARLAVVPLVLEARGLDVTPAMIAKLKAAEDLESAAILEAIYQDEIGHVAAGQRWFDYLCKRRGLSAEAAWPDLVRTCFKGDLKPPFNHAARLSAGMVPGVYACLTQNGASSAD